MTVPLNVFPRRQFADHIASLVGYPAANVVWDRDPQPFPGTKGGIMQGVITLSMTARDVSEGSDEYRPEFDEDTNKIIIDQISRRYYTISCRCVSFSTTDYAGDVLDTLASSIQRQRSLAAMREFNLVYVDCPFFNDIPSHSDNRATSTAVLDIVIGTYFSTLDLGDPDTNDWIETVEPLTYDPPT